MTPLTYFRYLKWAEIVIPSLYIAYLIWADKLQANHLQSRRGVYTKWICLAGFNAFFHTARSGLGITLFAYWWPTGLGSRTGRAMVVSPEVSEPFFVLSDSTLQYGEKQKEQKDCRQLLKAVVYLKKKSREVVLSQVKFGDICREVVRLGSNCSSGGTAHHFRIHFCSQIKTEKKMVNNREKLHSWG